MSWSIEWCTRTGSVRWFQARGTVLQDHEGKPRRMVGTDLDVTSLKRAEEEKALLEAKLRKFPEMLAHQSGGRSLCR